MRNGGTRLTFYVFSIVYIFKMKAVFPALACSSAGITVGIGIYVRRPDGVMYKSLNQKQKNRKDAPSTDLWFHLEKKFTLAFLPCAVS